MHLHANNLSVSVCVCVRECVGRWMVCGCVGLDVTECVCVCVCVTDELHAVFNVVLVGSCLSWCF